MTLNATDDSGNVTIYYTTDGTDPTVGSTVYT
ncbi:MAG: chitobiase/beta-hexosaminidase C-terminal domain-containing protein, partial [Methanobacterium paludis]|nr:chitobiase/beta-hexosaminidase C-terminal domain-containing protein [Methanobacterium paludis]